MLTDTPEKIAVFDVNGTLYNKKSKDEFFRFVCYKNSYKLLDLYHIFLYKSLIKVGAIGQTEFKENFFNYLDNLPPEVVDQYAREFWSIEYPRYFNHELLERVDYLREQGTKICCVSGGLDVYMEPLYEIFPVEVHLNTRVKYIKNTYKVMGEACKGKEKIRRLDEYFQGRPYHIVEAYSDDIEPLFDLADKAFKVEKGRLTQV